MLIPRNIIEEIAQRNDITEVVGAYALQRSGSNLVGLCPFTARRRRPLPCSQPTITFTALLRRRRRHVITFIMKAENLDFSGAAEYLANHAVYGLANTDVTPATQCRGKGCEINLEAARFFRDRLLDPEPVCP